LARKPEVSELDNTLRVDENIIALYISMDDRFAMEELQASQDMPQDVLDDFLAELAIICFDDVQQGAVH